MRDLLVLAVHLLVTAVKLLRPGGVRAVAAESVLLKHQLQVSNRSRQRAPNLTSFDRIVLGLATLFVSIPKIAAILKLATNASAAIDPLFRFQRWLANLRVLEIEEIKSVPWAPVSHPFVERLTGTIRGEYLDRVLFSGTWSTSRASGMNSGPITTRIVFTAPSSVSPRHSAAVRHHPCRQTSPPTRGNRIAAVCF
jgi:hypothetical protein